MEWKVTRGRGAHLAWPGIAKGERATVAGEPETRTEGSRDWMNSAVLTCVHAGRRVNKNKEKPRSERKPRDRARTHSQKRGGGRQATACAQKRREENNQKQTSKHRQRTHSTREQAAGERIEAIGA